MRGSRSKSRASPLMYWSPHTTYMCHMLLELPWSCSSAASKRMWPDKPAPENRQGLDGFWRWVLEALHAAAPDLFPGSGLPGDASGFEEAFSEVQIVRQSSYMYKISTVVFLVEPPLLPLDTAVAGMPVGSTDAL